MRSRTSQASIRVVARLSQPVSAGTRLGPYEVAAVAPSEPLGLSGPELDVAISPDDTGAIERLTTSQDAQFVYGWSGEGQTVLFAGGTPVDLYALSLEGERRSRPLLETEFHEIRPTRSPDGQWLAFECDEEGQPEIYVRPFPDAQAGRWKVSTEGGGDHGVSTKL